MADRPSRGSAPTPTPNPAPNNASAGTCGPDVTKEFASALRRIQSDFASWSKEDQQKACIRILFPVQRPEYTPGMNPIDLARSAADIDGWDMLPLYQGASAWLRDPALTGSGCAIPSSSDPTADAWSDAHEDPATCSDSVQVGSDCWLNGSVNYGTYGIMVKLCRDAFPIKFALAKTLAETLIRTYKAIGGHPEGADVPIRWFRATYDGGPTGMPSAGSGNRPNCNCSGCKLTGSVVNWDYVWEPVKPRAASLSPVLKVP